ncbi:MAG: hypothetical protein RL291_1244 [Pseudomonadota bacterium]
MTQSFAIKPARPMAIVLLAAIAASCWLLAYVIATALPPLSIVTWSAVITCIGLGVLFAWFAVAQRWSTLTIEDRQLFVRLPLFKRSFPIGDIVEGSPSKVDLQRDSEFRLAWRTFGLSVPGYHLGWFRTTGERVVLAAVTGNDAVSWVTKDGNAVLLSLTDSDAFLANLKLASSST